MYFIVLNLFYGMISMCLRDTEVIYIKMIYLVKKYKFCIVYIRILMISIKFNFYIFSK